MFEFSFVGILGAILLGAVIRHFFPKQWLGLVTTGEAAIHARLVLLEHKVGITEQALNPPTAAPVDPAALVGPAPAPKA
jgi:hypothetical protein